NRFFFFSSRRRHTRSKRDWSSDVCSSDLTFFQCATSQNSWLPFVVFTSQNMQGTLVHMPGNGDIGMVIAIVFVDNDQICHFHQRSEERRVGKECRYRC